MLIKPDCISCILKMAITAIRRLTTEEEIIRNLTVQILTIPALQGRQWDRSSPEVIEQVMEKIIEAFGTTDPFYTLKLEQNRIAQSLYPTIKNLVREADDGLQTAVKLAIVGNSIDLMITDHPLDLEQIIRREVTQPLPEQAFVAFREKLEKARSLVYLGDNAGEIVFDKLLLETIREEYRPEVIFVVRSVPALNDATRNEAEMVGLDQVAPLMPNGLQAPVPGTILSRCSPELRKAVREADLVISKGGGNFDTLEGEKDLETDRTFLLLSKCVPYCQYFQTQMYRPILANFFTPDPKFSFGKPDMQVRIKVLDLPELTDLFGRRDFPFSFTGNSLEDFLQALFNRYGSALKGILLEFGRKVEPDRSNHCPGKTLRPGNPPRPLGRRRPPGLRGLPGGRLRPSKILVIKSYPRRRPGLNTDPLPTPFHRVH